MIFLDGLLTYFEKGGFVMPPLALGTLILWYGMGYRFFTLRRGNSRSVRILVERYRAGYQRKPQGIVDAAIIWGLDLARRYPKNLRSALDDAFSAFDVEMRKFRVLIRSIVSVAPLAGLLGTVIGMIETFDSLGEMALFSQSGGIAGGISQALFTTQMGLAVAVPGIVVGRILDRRQQRLQDELEQVKQMLCAAAAGSEQAVGSEGARA